MKKLNDSNENNDLSLEEVLESDFDTDVSQLDSRENLAWLVISPSWFIITS